MSPKLKGWLNGVGERVGRGSEHVLPATLSARSLLFGASLLIILPALFLNAWLLQRYAKNERARADHQLEESARGTANLIDSKFATAEAELRILSSSPHLDTGDLKGFEHLLRRAADSIRHPIVLAEPNGQQLINTLAAEGAVLPRSDPSRWEPALREGRPHVTNVVTGTLTGRPTVIVTVPVIRGDTVKWTLSIGLYPEDFADVLAAPGVPANWVVSIVDRQGIHLARTPNSAEFAGRPLVPELIAHLKGAGTGTLRTQTLEGISVISTVARAPKSGWAVAIGRPEAELNAPLVSQLRDLFLIGLSVLLLTLTLAWLVARQIDRGIGILVGQARALARGEPVAPAPMLLHEGRIISEALGSASSQLRELTADLEARVRLRTNQLIEEMKQRAESEQQFSVLVHGVVDYALLMLDPQGIITNWNAGAERMKGYRAKEIVGQYFGRFYTDEDRAARKPELALETAVRTGKFETEGWRVRKDGSRFLAHVVIDAIRNEAGELIGFAKIVRDITESTETRKELELARAQLAQAQKIEAIGQLTGGIAHDFNNMLAVVLGSVRLMRKRIDRPQELQKLLNAVEQAADRAANLTRRLLAFARRQPLAPEPVDVNKLVSGMSEMLRRTIPESIEIETVLAGGLWLTRADPHALENALLNLVTNARDAMPEGGKLTIETANAYLDDAYAQNHAEVTAGQYVLVAVTDTGIGMPPEVAARAFEPFFTTKSTGKGTGLGLSQVYGFVKQSGGHVAIYSEPGHGVTVKLYLPRLVGTGSASNRERTVLGEELPRSQRGETILVVEDDPHLLALSVEMLSELGYRAIPCETAAEALDVLETQSVSLLMTDIVMPGMNGRQLADAALKRRPELKLLFMTGYTRNAVVHNGIVDAGVELLMKPFTFEALARKLNQILRNR